jgi:hypothetical protein
MTQEQLSRPVFIVNNLRVEESTYGEYLREYWADEVTSPIGVEPALFVQESEEGYELRRWVGSRSTLVDTFSSKADAELERFSRWENDFLNTSSNAPVFEQSYDQAISLLADRTHKSTAVIRRYLNLQARADEAARAAKQQHEKEWEEKKLAIAAEAAEITPDAQLLEEVRAAKYASSNEEKTKALATAQVAFLHRIGHYPIRTDFWRVFKIVNKKNLSNI